MPTAVNATERAPSLFVTEVIVGAVGAALGVSSGDNAHELLPLELFAATRNL